MANLARWPYSDTKDASTTTTASYAPVQQSDVIELPILLPEWQVVALEEAAKDRGMTVGQLLRRLVADVFPLKQRTA